MSTKLRIAGFVLMALVPGALYAMPLPADGVLSGSEPPGTVPSQHTLGQASAFQGSDRPPENAVAPSQILSVDMKNQPGFDGLPRAQAVGPDLRDPVKDLFRFLVNVRREDSTTVPDRRAGKDAGPSTNNPEPEVEVDQELEDKVREIKAATAGGLRWALDPVALDDGKIGFSVAGVSGFTVTTDPNRSNVNVGFRGESLMDVGGDRGPARAGMEQDNPNLHPVNEDDIRTRNMILKSGLYVWEILTNRMVVILVVSLVLARVGFAFAMAKGKSARRRNDPPPARPRASGSPSSRRSSRMGSTRR